jgi:dipeptidyl aminopeptidase/acylaminoacyl peptidase
MCQNLNCLIPILAATFISGPSRADDLETEVTRMAKIGSCWSPSFSPDGATIAFVSDLNGVPQVWTVSSAGGWPDLVTALDDPVTHVIWSPNGDWLAFGLAPGGGMNQQVYLVRPDGRELTLLTEGSKDNNWLEDWNYAGDKLLIGSSRRTPEAVDAWLYDLTAGKMQMIAESTGIGVPADLSRDGRYAVLWRMKSRSSNDLLLRDLTSGTEHVLTPHEGPGNNGGGLLSPDGKTVWLRSDNERDRIGFGRVRIANDGTPSSIEFVAAREDADVEEIALSRDGRTAALVWNVSGRDELELVDLASLKRTPVGDLPAELAGGLTFSSDGRLLAMVVTGAAAPHDIWVLDIEKRAFHRVTSAPHAGVDLSSLVHPELMTYAAHDGLELSGWLYRPRGVEAPAAYVLSFHGGPEGQELPVFRSDYQALLMRGIGVFAPNVRGSTGFGKRFVNLDNGELRYGAIRDIESTVEFLVSSKIADPKRIGIMGGSYGGYMTMAGLTWYPDLFAAGADLFGVVNFETFMAHSEPWMAAISTIEYGNPETQADLLRDLSPIHKIDRLKAPTIVLHGANDTNVPVIEAEQVVKALQSRNVPVKYVLFPDEGHGFRKTANAITASVSITRWFEEHLQ